MSIYLRIIACVLALVMLVLLPIISVVILVISRKSLPLYTEQQSVLDDVVLVTQENIVGIRVIKALSKADYEHRRYEKVNRTLIADESVRSAMREAARAQKTADAAANLADVVLASARA